MDRVTMQSRSTLQRRNIRVEREGGEKGRERKRRGPRNEFSSLRRSLVSDARRRKPALVVTLLRVGKVAAGSTIRASPRN